MSRCDKTWYIRIRWFEGRPNSFPLALFSRTSYFTSLARIWRLMILATLPYTEMGPKLNSRHLIDARKNTGNGSFYDSTDSLYDPVRFPGIRRLPLNELVQNLNAEMRESEDKIDGRPDLEGINKGGLVKDILSYHTELGENSVHLHYAMHEVALRDMEDIMIKLADQEHRDVYNLIGDRLNENDQNGYDFNNLPHKKLIEKAQEILKMADGILCEAQKALVC